MKITFAGAAREVTGSCHILEVGGRTVLLDCGMFQGRRSETREKNVVLPIDVRAIDAVVLDLVDPAGLVPRLVTKRQQCGGMNSISLHDAMNPGCLQRAKLIARRSRLLNPEPKMCFRYLGRGGRAPRRLGVHGHLRVRGEG